MRILDMQPFQIREILNQVDWDGNLTELSSDNPIDMLRLLDIKPKFFDSDKNEWIELRSYDSIPDILEYNILVENWNKKHPDDMVDNCPTPHKHPVTIGTKIADCKVFFEYVSKFGYQQFQIVYNRTILDYFQYQLKLTQKSALRQEAMEDLHNKIDKIKLWFADNLIDIKEVESFLVIPQNKLHKSKIPKTDITNIKLIVRKQNIKWSAITINVVSNDSIRINIKKSNFYQRYTFGELGFKDGRKGDLPNTQWELLKIFAEKKGTIDKIGFQTRGKIEKKISRLRITLKNLFGINEDPIPFDNSKKSYDTAFKIDDDLPDHYKSTG